VPRSTSKSPGCFIRAPTSDKSPEHGRDGRTSCLRGQEQRSRDSSVITEYARRVEQELHDEELARRMESIDEDRISRNAARQVAAAAPEPRPCTKARIFRHVLFSSFLAAIVVAFIYLFFINDSDLPRWVWDPEEFADEDVSFFVPRKGHVGAGFRRPCPSH
jgi:hypothetical protein